MPSKPWVCSNIARLLCTNPSKLEETEEDWKWKHMDGEIVLQFAPLKWSLGMDK